MQPAPTSQNRLAPMENGELLDRAFRLCGDNLVTFLGIVALVYTGPTLLSVLLVFARAGTLTSVASGLIQIIAGFICAPLASGALSYAVSERYLGREVGPFSALSRAWDLLTPLLTAQLRAGLWIIGGMLLLVVPGILLALSYSLVCVVVMIEASNVKDPLVRSRALVEGNRWRVFVLFAIIGIIVAIIGGGGGAVVRLLVGWSSLDGSQLGTLAQTVIGYALTPFSMTATLLLYYDFRIRKEGFDLELLSQELSGSLKPRAAQIN